MKTIKTTFGNKTIHDEDAFMLGGHIRKIISEHRAKLIDALLQNKLNHYTDYKFTQKFNHVQLRSAKHALLELREREISERLYAAIYESASTCDYVVLNNALFYEEIDATILSGFHQHELFGREMKFITTPTLQP